MLENNLPTGSEALALVHQYLPRVLAANGQQADDWHLARLLSRIARQQLQHHYFRGTAPAPLEAETVLITLERLDERLLTPDPDQTWPFAQMQLRRIMPLVQRILAA